MYSFYGGRPGNSFIIVANYESVTDMVTNFKEGPNYTDVHYDEYVIINTTNKNDPDNGKIYKRGYNFNNEMGGAEYVGTIVGPAGKAPMLELSTVADVNSKQAEQGFENRYAFGSYSPQNGSLVPGKDGNNFNDSISWVSYSIRDANHEDTVAYIGFTIPYFVFEFESEQVEPYRNGTYADVSSVTRIDDESHPFFGKWKLNIPKGIKGDSIKNFKVETASANIEPYQGQADDVNSNRKVLVYDYYDYNTSQNGAPKKLYLGDYNMIEGIDINNDGTIQIHYTHEDDDTWPQKLKWINSISLNNSTGVFTASYNQGSDYTVGLDWVKNLTINNDGTVTIDYTQSADKTYNKLIKWVSNITLLGDGTMTIHWNTGESDTVFSKMVKWISSVNLANDGTLTINYNNDSNPTVFTKALKWISGVNLANNGTLTFSYNNDSNPTVFTNVIKSLENVTINTGESEGQGSQRLAITWNNSNTPVEIGNPINYIIETAVDDENNLLVWYSDPARRALSDITFQNKTGWINVGRINPAAQYDLAQYIIQEYNQTVIGGKEQSIAAAVNEIRTAVNSGQPVLAKTAAQMTDHSKIYLYQGTGTGADEGYETGYLYYYIDGDWQKGASYGSDIVDNELNDSSTNPVQNRILTALIGQLQNKIENLQEQIHSGGGSSSSGDNEYIIDSGMVVNKDTPTGYKVYDINFVKQFQDITDSTPINIVLSIGTLKGNSGYQKVQACLLADSITKNGFSYYIANGSGAKRTLRVSYIAVQPVVYTPEDNE